MDEMARAAGITKPVLYRYFGDREGLIAAIGERFSEDLIARLDHAISAVRPSDTDGRIRAAISCYVAFIEEDPSLYVFLTRQAAPESPALVAVIEEVAGFVAGVIAETFLAAGLDPRPAPTFAHGIVGMVHLAGARWARTPEVSRDELVDDLVSLVAHGVTGAPVPLQRDP